MHSSTYGHMRVSNLRKQLSDQAEEKSRRPEEAARYLACFCPCGIYNLSRAPRPLDLAGSHRCP